MYSCMLDVWICIHTWNASSIHVKKRYNIYVMARVGVSLTEYIYNGMYLYTLECIYATWLIHIRPVTHSYTGHDSFIYGTWLTGHDSLVYGTWLTEIPDMTHWNTGHDSFIYGTWLLHIRDMTHCNTGHDSNSCIM